MNPGGETNDSLTQLPNRQGANEQIALGVDLEIASAKGFRRRQPPLVPLVSVPPNWDPIRSSQNRPRVLLAVETFPEVVSHE